MHSKTHLKFQFNSSINSTTSAHIIFFLNTTLHYESNKIGITVFGSTHLKIQKSQISIQNCIFELALRMHSHCRVGLGYQPTPPVSDRENRGGGFNGAAMVELADGDSSGDTEDTYAIYVMR